MWTALQLPRPCLSMHAGGNLGVPLGPSCPLLSIVVWCQVMRADALVSPASPTLPACLCSGHEECQAPAFPRGVQRAPKYADFLAERDMRGWRTWSHFVSQASLSMTPGLVVTFRRALIGPGGCCGSREQGSEPEGAVPFAQAGNTQLAPPCCPAPQVSLSGRVTRSIDPRRNPTLQLPSERGFSS